MFCAVLTPFPVRRVIFITFASLTSVLDALHVYLALLNKTFKKSKHVESHNPGYKMQQYISNNIFLDAHRFYFLLAYLKTCILNS